MSIEDTRRELARKKIEEKKAMRRKVMRIRLLIIGAAAAALLGLILWLVLRSGGSEKARSSSDGTSSEGTTEVSTTAKTALSPSAAVAKKTTTAKTEATTEAKQPLQRTAHVTLIPGLPMIDEYLGCSHLYDWMEEHFNDYYLKTPYDGIWNNLETPENLLKPYGEYGEEGGMNCSGFVSHLFYATGGDLSKVAAMELEGSYGDADSYLYLALRDLVQYEVFDSVEDLLASGKARKGDLLYLYPVKTKEDEDKPDNKKPDCHLGIFWGDTSSENKMWSSVQSVGNTVTEITMHDPIAKVYLIPINGN